MPESTAPKPGQLRNLEQIIGDNTGGVEAAWYVPVEDVLSVPDTDAPIIVDDVLLKTGAFWYQLVATQNTLRYTQPAKTDRHGDLYQAKLAGTLAKNTGELAAGLDAMSPHRFLVLYRDANGIVWLIGNLDEPLQWGESLDTGNGSNDRNQTTFSFANELTRRACCYRGQWTVSGVGVESGVVLQPGGNGTVQLRTAGGRLLATVAAGKTIVLKSGFKLNYLIQ